MSSSKAPYTGSESAARYDEQAAEQCWHGHELLFGLMFEFAEPGDSLLDVGVGTGLSSLLFHKAGLRVSGFDRSRDMLAVCESKGFPVQLVQHDLQTVPFPYSTASFDHVIALAVLNFLPDLTPVVEEVGRIIKPGGVFGFTVEEQKTGQEAEYSMSTSGDSSEVSGGPEVRMCRHADEDLRELLLSSGFAVLKDMEFVAGRYPAKGTDIYFRAYVCRKAECA